jgi:hypothetical protein
MHGQRSIDAECGGQLGLTEDSAGQPYLRQHLRGQICMPWSSSATTSRSSVLRGMQRSPLANAASAKAVLIAKLPPDASMPCGRWFNQKMQIRLRASE